MSITINTDNLRGEPAPLYHVYPRQTKPQPAYVELDEDGDVSADYNGEIGNAVPMAVWHRRTLRFDVSPRVGGDDLADFLESDAVVALLERIHAGHTVEWNGNNHVGTLDDDAQAAAEALMEALSGLDDVEVGDAYEWLAPGFALSDLVEGESIETLAASLIDEAAGEGITIHGSMEDAVAQCAAERIQREIDMGADFDPATLRAAEILAAYDEQYAKLPADYRAALADDEDDAE